MPRFEPFRAIRYDTTRVDLADVTAPPYDVIDPDERAELAARSAHNAVHADCPVGYSTCYEEAAAVFRRWQDEAVLVTDPEPTMTVYRMSFDDEFGRVRHTTGVLGALDLEPPGDGDVLPHEYTTPKARSDRLDLLRATHANLSPIWVLSLAGGLSKLLDPTDAPDADFVAADGVRHQAWCITDSSLVEAIGDLVGSAPVVIADGHHRYETCLTFAAERPDLPGAGATLAFAVELAEDELTVGPIHRLLAGLPDGFDLIDALWPWFEAIPTFDPDVDLPFRMEEAGALALVVPDGSWLLVPRPEALAAAGDLDTRRLDIALAALPPHELTFQHGVANVLDAVRSGRAQAAVLLRPVRVDQIEATAHARDRFPPKTTFFWPKPRTGLVFRSFA